MFLKKRNINSKIKRSKVTEYAALKQEVSFVTRENMSHNVTRATKYFEDFFIIETYTYSKSIYVTVLLSPLFTELFLK